MGSGLRLPNLQAFSACNPRAFHQRHSFSKVGKAASHQNCVLMSQLGQRQTFRDVCVPSAGLVSNITRPGGKITGFENFRPEIGGKWLGLLREAAPAVTRVGIVFDPENTSLAALRKVIETAAPTLGIQTIAIGEETFRYLQGRPAMLLVPPVALPDPFAGSS